jgi:predicted ribosome quality control (RQC) complex YloA/Tae2 family protein
MDLNISNLALHHLIEENQIIVNGFINKVQTTPEGLLKIKIHTKEGDKNLIATKNALFIAKNSINAKQNPGGFSAFLKKFIFNQRIISFEQRGFDRIVLMKFENFYLIFELFSKGNVILTDKDYKILRAMKKEKWKDRELKKDEIYKFPSSRGKNPLEIKESEFLKELKNSKKTVFGSIVDIINLAPGILDYIFEENNFNKKDDASEISETKAKKILKVIKEVYNKKEEGVYVKDNVIYSIDIGSEKSYDSINELLNDKALVFENKVEKKEEVKNVKRSEDYLAGIKKAEINEKEYQKIGEKIYLEYNFLDSVIKATNKLKKDGLNNKEIENKLKSADARIKEVKLAKGKLLIEI